jgi:FKBP-type peptidyl-prolyl cis-trans isomerase FkpA
MHRKSTIFLGLLLFATLMSSCTHRNNENEKLRHELQKKDAMLRVNRYLANQDQEKIKSYIKRHQLDMKTTQTGLWCAIFKTGEEKIISRGQRVTIKYKISLLDGSLCYESKPGQPKTFTTGEGGVESGLEEGILLLHKGDVARLIIPPYLAHGLLGDDDKIPPRAIIVYDVEVLNVK